MFGTEYCSTSDHDCLTTRADMLEVDGKEEPAGENPGCTNCIEVESMS